MLCLGAFLKDPPDKRCAKDSPCNKQTYAELSCVASRRPFQGPWDPSALTPECSIWKMAVHRPPYEWPVSRAPLPQIFAGNARTCGD